MDTDTLFNIFNFLQPNDLINCFYVSKQFNEMAHNNVYWKQFIGNEFTDDVPMTNDNYYERYMKHGLLASFLRDHHLTLDGIRKNNYLYMRYYNYGEVHLENISELLIDIKMLHFGGDRITSISGFEDMINVKKFYAHYNWLTSVPSLGKLVNLKIIQLHCNKLESVPLGIENLTKLESLTLEYNEIKYIPKEMGNLVSLNSLSLHMNPLESISYEIDNLVNLKSISIDKDKLGLLSKKFTERYTWKEGHNCIKGTLKSITTEKFT